MYERAKRVVDIVVALVGLALLCLLLPALAVAIKLDSPGPIFFAQKRIGRFGRPFRMFKLRSMINCAEEMIERVKHLNESDGSTFKITNDPRRTRVGIILRKSSLDEMPQFWNILRGEMSLVGPRPLPEEQVDLEDPLQRERLEAVPGLTGLWQTNGRSYLNQEEWLRADLAYVRHRSLRLDLKILLQTFPAVLSGKGAC